MKIKLLFSLVTIVLLTSCKQWKNLTAKDNSAYKPVAKQKAAKNVQFLEDISITPGQVVTSKHASIGTENKSRSNQSMIYTQTVADLPPGATSAERGNFLQLKYSMLLSAAPEKLANTYLLSTIDEWWGTRYCMGGSSKECIDCSAFSQVVMNNVYQVSLPRTAQEQYNLCEKVKMEELQEGDLVFFHTQGRAVSHVGIYLTNNKFVHASTSQGVIINDLSDNYWREKLKGAGRIKQTPLIFGN